jgi:hypothetical protein
MTLAEDRVPQLHMDGSKAAIPELRPDRYPFTAAPCDISDNRGGASTGRARRQRISILGDFVIEPTMDGLAKANIAKIVEHCFRQPLAIGEIEQLARGVIRPEQRE